MFTYSDHILKICIAQIAKNIGWKSINTSSFQVLIDLCKEFISDLAKYSSSIANHSNRNQVVFHDILFAFQFLGFKLNDFEIYLKNVPCLPFIEQSISKYPVTIKKSLRLDLASKEEIENRKNFYYSWLPTINIKDNCSKLEKEKSLVNIDLSQVDLDNFQFSDFENYKNKLDNLKKNISVSDHNKLNAIKEKIKKLNIGSYTSLTAKIPNYIYLSNEGKVLSYGGKEGKLPEAKIPVNNLDESFYKNKIAQISPLSYNNTKLKIKINRFKKNKKHKKSIINKLKKKEIKLKKDNKMSFFPDYQNKKPKFYDNQNMIFNDNNSKNNNLNKLDKQYFVNDFCLNQSPILENLELIVKELLIELITNVENDQKTKIENRSSYDENEAAKTLVLLSCDTYSKTNYFDTSLKNKNYSKHSSFKKPAKDIDIFNNTSDKNLNSYNFDNVNYFSKECLIDKNIDEDNLNLKIKKNKLSTLTKEDRFFSSNYNQSQSNSITCNTLFNKSFNENDTSINKTIPKITVKLKNGKISRSSKCSEKNINLDKSVLLSNNDSNEEFNFMNIKKNNLENIINTENRKKSFKGLNKNKNNTLVKNKTKEKIWFCPTCLKPDDGSPMIGCDGCDDWHHWICVGLKNAPKTDKWFCKKCNKQELIIDKKSQKVKDGSFDNKNKRTSKKRKKTNEKVINQSKVSWICPICNKQDDGTAMIGCDKCYNWFHWVCVHIYHNPKEDFWYCQNCSTKKKKLI